MGSMSVHQDSEGREGGGEGVHHDLAGDIGEVARISRFAERPADETTNNSEFLRRRILPWDQIAYGRSRGRVERWRKS